MRTAHQLLRLPLPPICAFRYACGNNGAEDALEFVLRSGFVGTDVAPHAIGEEQVALRQSIVLEEDFKGSLTNATMMTSKLEI